MSKIKIQTLTGVHIGSGVSYQKGTDFVVGKNEYDEETIAIIDPKKVMQLIGEKNIDTWVTAIQAGRPTNNIVKQFAPKAKPKDYALREILKWSDILTDTLKEFIHDGNGKPYIPGSSIKGAIRTAILSQEIVRVRDKENKILDSRNNLTAKRIESELFGRDPNSDVFRYLQVGDAIFGKNYEAAVRMVNINERNHQSYWDESKHQLIEILTPEDEATFDLNICMDHYDLASNHVGHLPDCMKSLPSLFKSINQHTSKLLESEIAHWEKLQDEPNAKNVDIFIDKLNDVFKKVKECQDKDKDTSCVIRIGHGSGWRFITGAWSEKLDIFSSTVVNKARPKNERYEGYDFPKSRRVDDNCELLGFVKLTILDY